MPSDPPFHSQVHDARGRATDLRRRVQQAGRDADPMVREEELHAQNESLAASQLMVEAERRRYADLFHFAPDPYLVTGPDGTVREANRAAAALLAVAERAFPGKPLSVFVARAEVRAFRE